MIRPLYAQIGRASWIFAVDVPWLPDVADDIEHLAGTDLLLGYHALAEVMAARAPASCALQIRLSNDIRGGGNGVRTVLLARASDEHEAADLYALVVAALPAELVLRPVTDHEVLDRLLKGYSLLGGSLVEVRRRIEDIAPTPVVNRRADPTQPAILRWAPDKWGLRHAGSSLSRWASDTSIILHLEPAEAGQAVFDHLDETIRDIAADVDVATSPLREQVAAQYRTRLRDFNRATVQLRVLIVTDGDPATSLAATVGLALTVEGGFVVARPRDQHQLYRWWGMVESLAAIVETGNVLDELGCLADCGEAAQVVRFPLPASGGSAGLYSSPITALPRGAELGGVTDRAVVDLGRAVGGGRVRLGLDELNQHLLVAGLPGFGKTVSVQTILVQLWRDHRVPFLVLDPAKTDYRQLRAELGDDLEVFEVGPDALAFNPFGIPAGCSPASHAGRVLAAFDAAFTLSSTWPGGYVTLARAIFRAYDRERVPTLDSLRAHLSAVIDESGFTGPDGSNIRAALLGRMEFLTHGPLGIALSAPSNATVDFASLASRPCVVGMSGFSGPLERALVFGLLLSGFISYRESNPIHGHLGHVTVLEEAHRLLAVRSGGPDDEGVRLFVEAIAELRGSGEGFVVVDQAPTLLHPGVLKLAGSYCSHRLVDQQERQAMGSGLLLNERQSQDLARLSAGQAVLHSATRTSGVVVEVEAPDGLFATQPSLDVQASLPWLPAAFDEPDQQFEKLIAGASSPSEALLEAAVQLQRTVRSPIAFERELMLIASKIRAEVGRRRQEPR